jgi:hypothetical protein
MEWDNQTVTGSKGSGRGSLTLHCGGERVDRDALRALPQPVGLTPTHFPISHYEFVSQTISQLEQVGVSVTSEAHGLMKDASRYFGIFGLGGGNDDDGYGLVVGLRNSHDRSVIAALALGAYVNVCDNLSFSGEVTIERKHTRWILRDLPKLMNEAVGKIVAQRVTMKQRVDRYREFELDDVHAHDLMIRSLRSGIVGASKLPLVVNEWNQPQHDEFKPRTAWSLFNAFTEVLKGYEIHSSFARSQPLHGLFDIACGLATVKHATPALAIAT